MRNEEMYGSIIRQVRDSVTQTVEEIASVHGAVLSDTTVSMLANAQKLVADVMTSLTDILRYEKTPVVDMLNLCYEMCYMLATGQKDMTQGLLTIKYACTRLENAWYWSVPETAYNLSVVSVVKNEAYIEEWIEYHRLVGVDHFYIYDNESTDNLKERLKKYIDAGIVTYIEYPGKYIQAATYSHAVEHFKYDTRWMAIIDGDEYIMPMEDGKLIPQILDEIKVAYEEHPMRIVSEVGGIGVNWRWYGTSGLKNKTDDMCIEKFNYRAPDDFYQNAHVKSIHNPRVIQLPIGNPHFARYIDGYINISERGSFIPYSYFYDSTCSRLRINHYYSKSEEELVNKIKRGWPDRDLTKDEQAEIDENNTIGSSVYDPIMAKYVDSVRQKLGK